MRISSHNNYFYSITLSTAEYKRKELDSFTSIALSVMLTLSLIALSLVLIYVYVGIKLNYWAKLEVPHMKPEFLIGNLRGFQTKYKLSTLIQTIYEQKKGTAPVIGLYIFLSPVVIVSDLDFLKNVFVKDFEYFSDRGLLINERDDPLSANLFSLPYTKWKPLRSKFSATFQASRLKAMYPLFNTVATELSVHLKSEILRSGEIDVTETFNQYTITLILQTVYGLESKCLGHPENIFCKMGPAIMQRRAIDVIKDLVTIIAPNLAKKLRLKFNREELRHFFTGLARDTVQYREMNNVMRNDFMALLMQLRKSRTLHGEDKAVSDGGGAELLTDDELAAQAFIFFFGGFETSSKTLSYILYELALNSNIQERAREEVQQVFQGNGHTFSYESLQKMTYLDQIINGELLKGRFDNSRLRINRFFRDSSKVSCDRHYFPESAKGLPNTEYVDSVTKRTDGHCSNICDPQRQGHLPRSRGIRSGQIHQGECGDSTSVLLDSLWLWTSYLHWRQICKLPDKDCYGFHFERVPVHPVCEDGFKDGLQTESTVSGSKEEYLVAVREYLEIINSIIWYK